MLPAILESHRPVDTIVLMLGTNDCKSVYSATPEVIGQGIEQLLDQIWGYEYIGDTRTVDVHIKRLREKIKDHASWAITTVWGIGYKFEVKK